MMESNGYAYAVGIAIVAWELYRRYVSSMKGKTSDDALDDYVEDECLRTVEHMAIAKYWYEKYGAEIVCLNSDQVEFWLPKPVTGDTDQLAEEHYVYAGNCMLPDYNCVLHDYTNLSTLASALKKITFWNFW